MFNTRGKPVQGITVLLVEDNPRDAALVAYVLGDRIPRFEVTTVGSLSGALRSLKDYRFDVILLDIVLPDSQGFATIAAPVAQAVQALSEAGGSVGLAWARLRTMPAPSSPTRCATT